MREVISEVGRAFDIHIAVHSEVSFMSIEFLWRSIIKLQETFLWSPGYAIVCVVSFVVSINFFFPVV